jgi:hypothetical protein
VGEARGVIDRIVEGRATVLVEGEGEGASFEVEIPVEELPGDAGEGSVVILLQRTIWEVIGLDEAETRERRADAEDRLAKLRRERGGGRFGREARDGGDEVI